MSTPDEFAHFISAQNPIYGRVLEELRQGDKRSHWMWFIFPQLKGLGRSETARRYALDSLEQAERYLQHPELGPRLRECTETVMQAPEHKSAEQIFGDPDYLKFRSSMTLFDQCEPNGTFRQALDRFYDSQPDLRTLELIGRV
ncbi:MAG: hypothetical protein E1N59_1311 [Puniceicoccaceae bacterium 5H]|nr:MAG: hypothetical protein E1N59_1311 [Puniceicoccaceae bacterium 5H]